MRRILFILLLSCTLVYGQSVDTLIAAQDNTLYESSNGDISNGAGPFFFAGVTNNGDLRRGLVLFDILNELPSGSIVDSVYLELWCSKIRSGSGSVDLSLHRLNAIWGEGGSTTSSQHGQGALALTPDATWLESMIGGIIPAPWNTPGGDFQASSSASQSVDLAQASFRWTSTTLKSDVQNMLDNPASNNGWLIKSSDENTNGTARQFNTKEGPNNGGAHAPRLIVFYQPPSVGLDQSNKNKIQLFPNPGNGSLGLQGMNAEANVELHLMDLTGRILFKENIKSPNQKVNTADLPNGVYLVRIIQNDELLTTLRWLKQ